MCQYTQLHPKRQQFCTQLFHKQHITLYVSVQIKAPSKLAILVFVNFSISIHTLITHHNHLYGPA